MSRKQNIDRVDHVVWIVHPENQKHYVDIFSKLFDTSFEGPREYEETGNCLWISWDAGLEILSPYGKSPAAQMWQKRLDARGEGFLAMVLGVADIETTRKRVIEAGFRTTDIIGSDNDTPWGEKLETFKEIIVEDEILGTVMAFGEIRYADGVIK